MRLRLLVPSLIHLYVCEVDRASHIHVPAVTVQTNAPSNDLSNCTRLAAAVSSQGSSIVGKNDCTGESGNLVCHGSLAPLAWCGLPPCLVGSQLLDSAQMKWPSAGNGTETRHAQRVPRRSAKNVWVARCPTPPPDAKRPSRVRPCQKSSVRCPTPKMASCLKNVTMLKRRVSRSWHVKLRECRASPLAKEEGSEPNDESGPLQVPTSARVVSGGLHHRLRILTDHLMSRDAKLEMLLLEQRAVRTSRDDHFIKFRFGHSQVGEVAHALSSRRRRNRRCLGRALTKMVCPGNSASPWFAASCW